MKTLFTGIDRDTPTPGGRAGSCFLLKPQGAGIEGDAENQRWLPVGLGAWLVGAEAQGDLQEQRGTTHINEHFHSFLHVIVKMKARCQGSWGTETEPGLGKQPPRPWTGRKELRMDVKGGTVEDSPTCVVACGAWSVNRCRIQLFSVNKEHGESL